MHVYFIVTNGCNPRMLKIGKANDVDSRLHELQCACPFDLELRGKLACKGELHAFEVERDLHKTFKKYRRRGEWFLYNTEVKYAIDSIVAAGKTDGFPSHLFNPRAALLPESSVAMEG